MNLRQPPPASAGKRGALLCLSFALLSPMVLASNLNGARRYGPLDCVVEKPRPYLRVIGSPPLRFQELPVIAEPPPAVITEVIRPNLPDILPAAVDSATAGEASPATEETKPDYPAFPGSGKVRSPAPIMPDDNRPAIRAEDFLPYFQFPGNSGRPGEITVIAPLPSNAPPADTLRASSATYIQTQK